MCFSSMRLQRLAFTATGKGKIVAETAPNTTLLWKLASLKGTRKRTRKPRVSDDMSPVPESLQDYPVQVTGAEAGQLVRRISELGEWFHNFDLHGVATAPHHFLGDFPNVKWKKIADAIPDDLTGASVLD